MQSIDEHYSRSIGSLYRSPLKVSMQFDLDSIEEAYNESQYTEIVIYKNDEVSMASGKERNSIREMEEIKWLGEI